MLKEEFSEILEEYLNNLHQTGSAWCLGREGSIKFLEDYEKHGTGREYLYFKNQKEEELLNLNKMYLVYMFCLFEGYISDIIYFLFKNKSECLKSEQKKIDFNFQYFIESTKEEMLESIIRNELVKISVNPDRLKDYFIKNPFRIDLQELCTFTELDEIWLGERRIDIALSKESYWEDLREYYNMRNVIVHRSGVIDQFYIDNIKNSKYKIGDKPNINDNYVNYCLELIAYTMVKINLEFTKKYANG